MSVSRVHMKFAVGNSSFRTESYKWPVVDPLFTKSMSFQLVDKTSGKAEGGRQGRKHGIVGTSP